MRKIMKTKKVQEEMVGFVLIIVLVSVIAVVFLGISLRKGASEKNSLEIKDFLYSSMLYSVDCSFQVENVRDLILACYNSEACDSGSSCELLEDTYLRMINSSLRLGESAKYQGYVLKIVSGEENVLSASSGNSTKSLVGSNIKILTYESSINISLKMYY